MSEINFSAELAKIGRRARAAARQAAMLAPAQKNACIEAMATALADNQTAILEANALDLKAGRAKGLSAALLDRLELNPKRLQEMGKALLSLTGQSDPVGRVESTWLRPNGLEIRKIRVPIGVIGIIYEARPNVTVDSAGLCFKAGNAVILRGGSESINSNLALARALNTAAASSPLPPDTFQLLPWTDREAVNTLLRLDKFVDLIIPRGGESLIRTVVENSTIPVIKHYKGVCHVFVDRDADPEMALRIIENAKCQRPGVCNAVETVLIDRPIAAAFAPRLAALLAGRGVRLRGDEEFCRLVPSAQPATEDDWYAEYLDLILAVRVVDGLAAAADHIAQYGSAHSDAIVTGNQLTGAKFCEMVDSAAVYVNASTRFTDGGQFGMGAEIGISTDRIHARGPMGVEELTTYKYVVTGTGQIRE